TENRPCHLQAFVERRNLPIQLPLVDLLEDFAHSGARVNAELEQMPSHEQWLRGRVLDAERPRALEEPVHGRAVEGAGAAEAIGLRDAGEQLEVDLLREAPERAVADRGG